MGSIFVILALNYQRKAHKVNAKEAKQVIRLPEKWKPDKFKTFSRQEVLPIVITYRPTGENLMPTVVIQKMNCLRCGHTWTPRQAEIRICPKCKSPYWDRPRKQTGGDPQSPP